MSYQFIEAQRQAFAGQRLCQVLHVAPSGYYAWRKRQPSPRKLANQELLQAIEGAPAASNATYGSPRSYQELRETIPCSENRVARLMRQNGLCAKQGRRYKATTKANPAHPLAPHRLARDFTAEQPNQKWTADRTYLPTCEGWLYGAVILDLFSRRRVGWAMAARMTSQLVMEALTLARRQRQPEAALRHPSARGSQDTGQPYQQLLAAHHCQLRMRGRGHCDDNAPTESFFGKLKTEQVYDLVYPPRAAARTALFFYIEAFYNRRRRHSTLGYLSPAAFEAAYYQSQLALTSCP